MRTRVTRRRSNTDPPLEANPTCRTTRRKLQSCTVEAEARGNHESKKKMECIAVAGTWDVNIPEELLREILSRVGLKSNVLASLVCKTWREAALPVRKLPPRPWLCYEAGRSPETGSTYLAVEHPMRSKSNISKLDLPELKDCHMISCSRDGWVLLRKFNDSHVLFLNPFTKQRIVLPEGLKYHDGNCLAFSAPPTSASCVVMECVHPASSSVVISTWRPGETAWTLHRFETPKRRRKWDKCVFSNGVFYCLSIRGRLGVFDPAKVTWNVLPVKPCPDFVTPGYIGPVLLAEHEGDVFVMFTRVLKKPLLFRLNHKSNVWEEKRDLGGLTVFANNDASSLIIAGLAAEDKNRIYRADIDFHNQYRYYSLVGGKRSRIIPGCIAWVESQQQHYMMKT